MKKLITSAFLVLFTHTLFSQPSLIPYRQGGKWGYCDKAKKIIIPPIYQEVGFFKETYTSVVARVKKQGKFGLINQKGEVVLPSIYNDVSLFNFKSHFVRVKSGEKWKLKHKFRDLKTTPYDSIIASRGGFFFRVRQKQKWGLINYFQEVVLPTKYDSLREFRIRFAMPEVLANINTDDDVFKYPEAYKQTLQNFRVYLKKGKKVGIYHLAKKKWTVPRKYNTLRSSFIQGGESENFAIQFYFIVSRKQLKGVCDVDHNFKIPLKYHTIQQEGRGEKYFKVSLKGKYGFVYVDGREIIPLKYDFIDQRQARANMQMFYEVGINDRRGFLDKNGTIVIPIKYDKVTLFSSGRNVIFEAELGNKGFRFNEKGKVIKEYTIKRESTITTVRPFVPLSAYSLEPYQKNGKWGFAKAGKKIFITCKYDVVTKFDYKTELAKVKYKGKWGYIDKQGREYWKD